MINFKSKEIYNFLKEIPDILKYVSFDKGYLVNIITNNLAELRSLIISRPGSDIVARSLKTTSSIYLFDPYWLLNEIYGDVNITEIAALWILFSDIQTVLGKNGPIYYVNDPSNFSITSYKITENLYTIFSYEGQSVFLVYPVEDIIVDYGTDDYGMNKSEFKVNHYNNSLYADRFGSLSNNCSYYLSYDKTQFKTTVKLTTFYTYKNQCVKLLKFKGVHKILYNTCPVDNFPKLIKLPSSMYINRNYIKKFIDPKDINGNILRFGINEDTHFNYYQLVIKDEYNEPPILIDNSTPGTSYIDCTELMNKKDEIIRYII